MTVMHHDSPLLHVVDDRPKKRRRGRPRLTTKKPPITKATRSSARVQKKYAGPKTVNPRNRAPTAASKQTSSLFRFHTNNAHGASFDDKCVAQGNISPEDPEWITSNETKLTVHMVLTLVSKRDLQHWKSYYAYISSVWDLLAEHAGMKSSQLMELRCWRVQPNGKAGGSYGIHYIIKRALFIDQTVDGNNKRALHAGNIMGILNRICSELKKHDDATFDVLKKNSGIMRAKNIMTVQQKQAYFKNVMESKQITMAVLGYLFPNQDYEFLNTKGYDLFQRVSSKQSTLQLLMNIISYQYDLTKNKLLSRQLIDRTNDHDIQKLRYKYESYGDSRNNDFSSNQSDWLQLMNKHATRLYPDSTKNCTAAAAAATTTPTADGDKSVDDENSGEGDVASAAVASAAALSDIDLCVFGLRLCALLNRRGKNKNVQQLPLTATVNSIPIATANDSVSRETQLLFNALGEGNYNQDEMETTDLDGDDVDDICDLDQPPPLMPFVDIGGDGDNDVNCDKLQRPMSPIVDTGDDVDNDINCNCDELHVATPISTSDDTEYDPLEEDDELIFVSDHLLEHQQPVLVLYPGRSGAPDDVLIYGAKVVVVKLGQADIYIAQHLQRIPHKMSYLKSCEKYENFKDYGSCLTIEKEDDYESRHFCIYRRHNNSDIYGMASLAIDGDPENPATKMNWYRHLEYAKQDTTKDSCRDSDDVTFTRHHIGIGNYSQTKNEEGNYKMTQATDKKHYMGSSEFTKFFLKQVSDGMQRVIDTRFLTRQWPVPYGNHDRYNKYGGPFRNMMGLEIARGELITHFILSSTKNFAQLTPVKTHVDTGNGGKHAPGYEYTLCMHFQMQNKKYRKDLNAPIYRQVVNMNSRARIDTEMNNDEEWNDVWNNIDRYMERVSNSYYVYKSLISTKNCAHPCLNLKFESYEDLVLSRDLDWVGSSISKKQSPSQDVCNKYPDVQKFYWIALAAGPSRDYYESACPSVFFDFIEERRLEATTMPTTVLLLLNGAFVALYYSSFHQYVPIVNTLLAEADTEELLQQLNTEFPQKFQAMHDKLFPLTYEERKKNAYQTIDGGECPRQQNSAINFRREYVEQPDVFHSQVKFLKQFMDRVNDTSNELNRSQYETLLSDTSKKLKSLDHFRVSSFISLISKMGLICKDRLHVADWRTASKNVKNGSYSVSQKLHVPDDRNQTLFHDITLRCGLPKSERTGECISCEANRKKVRFDLFYKFQNIYHLFGQYDNNKSYSVKYKKFHSNIWIELVPLILS